MERMTVTLGERSYPITIGEGLFNDATYFWPLKSGDEAMVVTNHTLSSLYLETIINTLLKAGIKVEEIILPDGEQHKTLFTLDKIYSALLEKTCGRDTTIIALGGGVIGDLVGFAAATYQRGVRLIQVPTTLLSQVDASVGGKTAVNHSLGKNMIGAFYQPASVVMNVDCLTTLPKREFSSGLAEVIKYGIAIDADFFCWIEENLEGILRLEQHRLSYCIRRCCELKANIITVDEREQGTTRALLNLGHTYGHAIESYMGYSKWRHGEAISAGMMMALHAARRLGQFSLTEIARIRTLLLRAGLPVHGPKEATPKDYLPYMMRDKKAISSKLRLVLPLSIGTSAVRSGVSNDVVLASIMDCQDIT